jgi:predicted Fe-Mo cluster-binding NifX family protein
MDTKKIAIATDDKTNISMHLGRCKYFAIYTIAPHEIVNREYLQNTFTHQSKSTAECEDNAIPGMADHSHDELLKALSECRVVLSGGIGQRLIDDLKRAGIRAYVVADEGGIEDLVQKYLEGELVIDRDGGCAGERQKP